MIKNFVYLLTLLLVIFIPGDSNDNIQYVQEKRNAIILNAKMATKPPKIVLITVDGTRWQDMYDAHEKVGPYDRSSRELLPNMYEKFVDNGMAIGKTTPAFVAGPAHISQPGYLEIIRGYPSIDCLDNYCKQNAKPTIINQFANNAAVISGWETIAKTFDNSLAAVNIGRRIRNSKWNALKIPETDSPEDYFGEDDYRFDADTSTAAISLLQKQQPDFLWISFGDTDEWAHQGNTLFYWTALVTVDEFVHKISKLTDPNTVYIMCPDHGRSDDFRNHGWDAASGRVWIFISGPGIPKAGLVSYNRNVYLADIVPTVMEIAKREPSSRSLLNYQK